MMRVLRVVELILGFILAVMAVLVTYQVIARYVLNEPPSWTEELARFLQVWLVMLGAPACLGRGMHLAVDYLGPCFEGRSRRLLQGAVYALVATYSLVLTVYGVRLLLIAALQTSPALGISMVWPYLAVPTGAAIMSVQSLLLIASSVRGRTARVE